MRQGVRGLPGEFALKCFYYSRVDEDRFQKLERVLYVLDMLDLHGDAA